jgi:hypothetical protein
MINDNTNINKSATNGFEVGTLANTQRSNNTVEHNTIKQYNKCNTTQYNKAK